MVSKNHITAFKLQQIIQLSQQDEIAYVALASRIPVRHNVQAKEECRFNGREFANSQVSDKPRNCLLSTCSVIVR